MKLPAISLTGSPASAEERDFAADDVADNVMTCAQESSSPFEGEGKNKRATEREEEREVLFESDGLTTRTGDSQAGTTRPPRRTKSTIVWSHFSGGTFVFEGAARGFGACSSLDSVRFGELEADSVRLLASRERILCDERESVSERERGIERERVLD